MSTKLIATALLFCSAAYGQTNAKVVGSAAVRGNLRIDGNQVTSDATLFDGSTVETTDATATLQMGSHAVVLMNAGTRSIVHDGYITLDQGKIDVRATCGFVVDADQVRVTPNSSASHGVVYISNSSVSVLAMDGEFLILDKEGRVLGTIHSGQSQAFSAGKEQTAGPATYAGTLSSTDNHPMLTLFGPDNKTTYELQGRSATHIEADLQSRLVLVNGAVDPKRSSYYVQDVIATKQETAMCRANAPLYPWLLASTALLGGAAAAIVVTNGSPTPASR